ncbi:hypothetical protein MXAN_7478 [Myxococcus xanthus DK 1622]|uniref:Uncharacterized protein n=1 Tax=Myxococcus xanthus (strain DK1622) TaxID=246197 RepID=Q1CVJ2_MYXXD|nr:hypothetical protein MXAN_7478 [Myxococcus xanthus DK 1622]
MKCESKGWSQWRGWVVVRTVSLANLHVVRVHAQRGARLEPMAQTARSRADVDELRRRYGRVAF